MRLLVKSFLMNDSCFRMFVYCPIGIKDGVYNLKVSGNESVFFSFV